MTVDERDDEAFILDQEQWPLWPVLPMKRRGTMDTGFLAGPYTPTNVTESVTLYLGNIYRIADAVPCEYGTVRELLADGWVVD